MWVIKVKNSEWYLNEECKLVDLQKAKTHKSEEACKWRLTKFKSDNYPEFIYDRSGCKRNDFEFIEVKQILVKT
jgi:hypothetical protein